MLRKADLENIPRTRMRRIGSKADAREVAVVGLWNMSTDSNGKSTSGSLFD